MAKTREIKKRIKAVGNIKRITKTMQMIATAKFAASLQRATATKPYTEGLFDLVRELAATAGSDLTHPLITGPAGGAAAGAPDVTLIITSDRGLCGPYNGSVLRVAMSHIRSSDAARKGRIELVGKKGAGFLRYNRVEVAANHTFGDKPSFDAVSELAQKYMDAFTRGELSGVRVIYMKFLSAGKQAPEVMQLLPLKPTAAVASRPGGAPAEGGAAVLYEFSPPAEELLGDLLPAAVKAMLFQAFNDAVVSENIARMVAMKSATDAAGKMGKTLTRQFNRARQAQITTELSEIIAGAAALK
ncbi:MAG: ATP synthase F1 subunit gamma [Phycisphaerae bacterium]|nr:ATP synthase F1 subunit gamma [Phycisphaerae bacterium]